MNRKIEISYKTIFFTIFFIIGLYLIFLVRDVLLAIFVSVLVATALNPFVTKLEQWRIPRSVGIIFIYVFSIGLLIGIMATILPPLVEQTTSLLSTLPIDSLSQRLYSFEGNLQDVQVITNQLGSVKPLLKIITSTFSGLVAVFTFLVMTYYMLMERTNLNSHLHQLFKHESQAQQAITFINKLEFQIGGWVRGELALMFIVGTITYFGLILLNIPYAIPLAILAGLLELIPNLGPTISAIPAIIVALLTSPNPLVAVFVVILYIFVQQFENNIIVPRVMKTAVGLHPLITIISIIIGLKLAGIAGGVLAVPLFLILKVTYTQLIEPKLRHQQSE